VQGTRMSGATPSTIQTCWDADRLIWGGSGITPSPFYLKVKPPNDPHTIRWADDLRARRPGLSRDRLVAMAFI